MVTSEFDGLFADAPDGNGVAATNLEIARAEHALGVSLPRAYIRLLRFRNGGYLKRRVFRTPFATTWADDHFEVRNILGVGGEGGIDAAFGSQYLIREWEYPPIGPLFAMCPSGGHDAVMLDYTNLDGTGEPSVAYVDEDRIPWTVAEGFDAFLSALEAEAP